MSEDASSRIVDALLRLHTWLTVDFVHLLNFGSQITDAECRPLYEAYQIIMDEQFRLDAALFTLAKRTVQERLFTKISAFLDAMNAQIKARDDGNRELQQALLAQANVLFNGLVKDFEQDLHDVKKLIDRDAATQPVIHLPSLSYVGGGIVINSPNARQNVSDNSTHVSSAITNSPGAIANVAQHLAHVANHVTQQVNDSAAQAEVKALMHQLATQIASLNPSTNAEKAQQMADDLKVLGAEVARADPRRKWYELSLEGIKEAATAIGEIGKPILATVGKLLPLLVP